MKILKLFTLLFFGMVLNARGETQIAECTNSTNTAGAYIFSDGMQIYLQVAAVAEQVDLYRTNAGAVPQLPQDINGIIAQLNLGKTRLFTFTKDASVLSDGRISNAALLILKLEPRTSSELSSFVSRRSEVIPLSCHKTAAR